MRRGKKYAAAAAKYDKQKRYELNEAVKLVKEAAFAKFDETVELSVKLNLKKGQSVRDTVVLPNQFAAEKRILVFAKGEIWSKKFREVGLISTLLLQLPI